ncbi:hypothetical protein N7492_007599 [Penicillium capsulatum]|uniref:Uncharacterized protein n=1 Tax=Penicillium capsulatum TaxID=69766 RepID=A0A9W9I2S0_9EURO|nr:hypothetical protein N7492_007599 [Penicillium capsulatum]KAJ6117434.1 hypothetical protein N7512_007159 [Penicillium capsulatum]
MKLHLLACVSLATTAFSAPSLGIEKRSPAGNFKLVASDAKASVLGHDGRYMHRKLPIGVTGNGQETPKDAQTDQFDFYGSLLLWKQDRKLASLLRRLKETSVRGVYQVAWDTSKTAPGGAAMVQSQDVQ